MYKELLKDKTAKEREKIKVEALSKVKIQKFTKYGFDIELLEVGIEGELLKVIARATKNGQEVFASNPLYYKNPPILVPDGTKKPFTNELGITYMIDNFKEDLEEALREIVGQTINLSVK